MSHNVIAFNINYFNALHKFPMLSVKSFQCIILKCHATEPVCAACNLS